MGLFQNRWQAWHDWITCISMIIHWLDLYSHPSGTWSAFTDWGFTTMPWRGLFPHPWKGLVSSRFWCSKAISWPELFLPFLVSYPSSLVLIWQIIPCQEVHFLQVSAWQEAADIGLIALILLNWAPLLSLAHAAITLCWLLNAMVLCKENPQCCVGSIPTFWLLFYSHGLSYQDAIRLRRRDDGLFCMFCLPMPVNNRVPYCERFS